MREHARLIAFTWILGAPFLLLSLSVLVWGWRALSRAEIRKGLAWTVGCSLTAFPIAMASLGTTSAIVLSPAYSVLIACAAFKPRLDEAQSRGAPRPPPFVRAIAGSVLALIVLLALSVVSKVLTGGLRPGGQ